MDATAKTDSLDPSHKDGNLQRLRPRFRIVSSVLLGLMLIAFGCRSAAFAGEPGNSLMERLAQKNSSGPSTLFRWSYEEPDDEPETSKLDEPLVTDRPDFTEASTTVGQGVAQLELGYTYTSDRNNGDSMAEHSFGEPLLRYGVGADWFELRFALRPTHVRQSVGGVTQTDSGVSDLYLGVKLALTAQQGIFPEMALVPQMTVPTGSRAFTNDEVLAGVNWLYSWDVTDELSIAGSSQFNRSLDDSGDSYIQFAQSLSAGYAFTDELGAYAEWYVLTPASSSAAPTEHYIDGGFTVLLNNDVQWDIRAGKGVSSAAADYFVGTGLSVRFH